MRVLEASLHDSKVVLSSSETPSFRGTYAVYTLSPDGFPIDPSFYDDAEEAVLDFHSRVRGKVPNTPSGHFCRSCGRGDVAIEVSTLMCAPCHDRDGRARGRGPWRRGGLAVAIGRDRRPPGSDGPGRAA